MRLSARWIRARLVVPILAAAVLLASLIAFEALTAGRAHRAAAESTLRDYAALAAWEFVRASRNDVESAAAHVFSHFPRDGVTLAGLAGGLPDPVRYNALPAVACDGGCPRFPIKHFFALGLDDTEVLVQDSLAPPGFAGWLRDSLRTYTDDPARTSWKYGIVPRETAEGERLIVYMVTSTCDTGEPETVYGFEMDPRSLVPIFERVVRQRPLLPPSLLQGAGSDSLLTLVVRSMSGEALFAHTPHGAPDFAAQDTLAPDHGGYVVEVGLKRAAAPMLVIGGLPKSRLPFLITLVLLTAGLILVAVHLMRRESELVRIRSEFVAGVSHELRTPIAQIRMFTETLLLDRVRSESERRRSLAIIDQEVRRLSHLIDNVLLFSKSQRHDAALSLCELSVGAVVQVAVEAFRPVANGRDVRVALVEDAAAVAMIDEAVLQQVILNLLDNAVKYGPVGQTVIVAVQATDKAVISVEDQGPGIPSADRERIWEPYVRLPASSSSVAGSGIGLSVVRKFVELHGGTVRVEPGSLGARFVVAIPLVSSSTYAGGDSQDGAMAESAFDSVSEDGQERPGDRFRHSVSLQQMPETTVASDRESGL